MTVNPNLAEAVQDGIARGYKQFTCAGCGELKQRTGPTQRWCRECSYTHSKYYWSNKPKRTFVCERCGKEVNRHRGQATAKWCRECCPDNLAWQSLRKYGLLLSDGPALCEICHTKPVQAIDHDHDTGAVRGWLCLGCNSRLGVLDDTDWCKQANAYLYASNYRNTALIAE